MRRMTWTGAVAVLAALAAALGSTTRAADPAPRADFYVAPTGDDAWSGGLPQADAARSDGPFRTLARARDAGLGD